METRGLEFEINNDDSGAPRILMSTLVGCWM